MESPENLMKHRFPDPIPRGSKSRCGMEPQNLVMLSTKMMLL